MFQYDIFIPPGTVGAVNKDVGTSARLYGGLFESQFNAVLGGNQSPFLLKVATTRPNGSKYDVFIPPGTVGAVNKDVGTHASLYFRDVLVTLLAKEFSFCTGIG